MRSIVLAFLAVACGSDVSYYGVGSDHGGDRWDADGDGIYERRLTCDQVPGDFKVPAGALVEYDDCTDGDACDTADLGPSDGSVFVPDCSQYDAYLVLRWYFPAS